MKGYPCPKCGKDTVRTQVDLTLDIPSALEHRLSKRNIATKDVVPMGATWDLATSYCPCGWSMSLSAKRFDTLLAKNAKLRAVAEAAREVSMSARFSLSEEAALQDLDTALAALEAP